MDNKILNFKRIKMVLALILGLLILIYAQTPKVQLITYWTIVLYACYLVKFDITHPYCWFSVTFALYNTAYIILYALGYDVSAGFSLSNAIYSYIGMSVTLLILSPEKRINDKVDFENKINYKANRIFFVITAFLSISFALILKSRGYEGKTQMQGAGDKFYIIGVHLVRWMMVMMLIQMGSYKCASTKKNIFYCVIALTSALCMGLCTGERDIIFRAFLLVIITLFYFNRIKMRHLLLLVPIVFFGMIASVYLKYYFLRGVGNTTHMESGNLIYQFLMTDFYGAGRNNQFLLNKDWTKGYFGIKLLINEIFRGIIPGIDFINPSYWYNYEVYPGGFKGQAFTMVGFGYVIDGLWSIILVFTLIGLFIKYTYENRNKGLYNLVFYLFSISIVMGSFRQTINTIINISIKAALVVILLSKMFSIKKRISRRNTIKIVKK